MQLSLPAYEHKLIKKGNKLFIFEQLRKKYIELTPEEWVRQNIIRYLRENLSYPYSLMKSELHLLYGERFKRSDIVCYDSDAQVYLLIECKAEHITLTEKELNQLLEYNHILQSKYIALTNGKHCMVYALDYENQKIEKLDSLPLYTRS